MCYFLKKLTFDPGATIIKSHGALVPVAETHSVIPAKLALSLSKGQESSISPENVPVRETFIKICLSATDTNYLFPLLTFHFSLLTPSIAPLIFSASHPLPSATQNSLSFPPFSPFTPYLLSLLFSSYLIPHNLSFPRRIVIPAHAGIHLLLVPSGEGIKGCVIFLKN